MFKLAVINGPNSLLERAPLSEYGTQIILDGDAVEFGWDADTDRDLKDARIRIPLLMTIYDSLKKRAKIQNNAWEASGQEMAEIRTLIDWLDSDCIPMQFAGFMAPANRKQRRKKWR